MEFIINENLPDKEIVYEIKSSPISNLRTPIFWKSWSVGQIRSQIEKLIFEKKSTSPPGDFQGHFPSRNLDMYSLCVSYVYDMYIMCVSYLYHMYSMCIAYVAE